MSSSSSHMNNPINSAVRKIHNLLSSGAVTVTGPNQPRILKQKVGATTVTSSSGNNAGATLQQQNNFGSSRCYVCDDAIVSSAAQQQLTEMNTSHTNTKFPNKIGQLVGDAFMVIVSVEDVVCSRCTNLINYLDRLENDVERVRANIMNLLHKKYGLNDDSGGGGGTQSSTPPLKMAKLTSGSISMNRVHSGADDGADRVRKDAMNKQTPPVSAVQQLKITTPQHQQPAANVQQQQLQRKTTKIYKCLACDYKTSDMRLFNTHYESCKQQNFQCKNCKKIFPNFGAMKQHMIKDHSTPMDNTCAVCHINFVSETALRKHMEINHSTSVVVTSSANSNSGTTQVATVATSINAETITAPTTGGTSTTPLYTCNHCQFKSTDKPLFDEHMRKHMSGNKPKPFKCRLCSQRFETREQATVHAKQHQPNYFKCGTCAKSFPKRELLVKHFEEHQQQRQPSPQPAQKQQQQQQQQHQQQQQQSSNTMLTTQKLLQETIDEALSDTVATSSADAGGGTAGGGGTAAANSNIRFFSCHVCSLTFIQENYYNQHMETHKREKKTVVNTATAAPASNMSNNTASMGALNSAVEAAILSTGGLSSMSQTSSKSMTSSNLLSTGSGGAMQQQQHSNASNTTATISEADIESIFEKMHSDKGDAGSDETGAGGDGTAAGGGGDNLVITSQAGTGGITFNITIPQPDGAAVAEHSNVHSKSNTTPTTSAPVSVSIDMPMLDQADEPASSNASSNANAGGNSHKEHSSADTTTSDSKQAASSAGPVSMPSLDDDNDAHEQQATQEQQQQHQQQQQHEADSTAAEDATQNNNSESGGETAALQQQQHAQDAAEANSQEEEAHAQHEQGAEAHDEAAAHQDDQQQQQVTMELDEAMQAQVESGQIKFILNENGQLLQLDNHIITDADGNQILVQDPEQIQQLLQSVGVLQSGDGLDGETLQMMTDSNGQMVLVQGDNNETQLIDASLLNADGQLVIQQGQDGDLSEGAHVIGEDGTRIPVSVSYTADGQPIVQVQQQVMESADGQQQQQQLMLEEEKDAAAEGEAQSTTDAGAASSGGFFALEELMQQSADSAANAKETE